MGGFIGHSPWAVAALVAVGSTAGIARADVSARLAFYETEARELGRDLPRPNQISDAAGQRRLLDAELAYSLGDYDGAAQLLFELAAKPSADRDTASFYLAEALFQKGDHGLARGYYEQAIASGNATSKYYQPALGRLIEIAILEKDDTNVAQHLAALDRISPGLRRPSVPYVRGKLAYSQGKYDEALAYFQDVPKGSEYELQATYYVATSYVAKKDPQRAIDIFTDLIGRKPRTANDRRIVELSQLALGRLYYERDQASKSIDSYLLVDRHSDLFPDALYEVAWVYVKSKQYDKALRALELLSRSDPTWTKTPTVHILEGNLRIRKAQMIRSAQVLGTADDQAKDDPEVEYDKAVQVFTETHDVYMPSYAALAKLVDGNADPAQYLAQIAGRSGRVFQSVAPLPEAAVQYLRDEPEVRRVVAVETDLGDISADLAETEVTIARLEGVLAAKDKSMVYPALGSRRLRIAEIQDDLIKIRSDLADQALGQVDRAGDLAQASAHRKQLFAAYVATPNAEKVAAARLAQHQAQYDAVERSAAEVDGAIGTAHAVTVALRKYVDETAGLPANQKKAAIGALEDAAREGQSIEHELDAIRQDIQIGRDLAEVGDEGTTEARAARAGLKSAEDVEYKALARASRGKAQALVALGDRAARLADQLEQTDRVLASFVEQGLAEVRGMLAEEKANLAACKALLREYEAEASSTGGSVLADSEKIVKGKLYDIVVRSDVGTVDVSWSQKQDTDDDLKRLNLSRQREFKQLKDEFKDILEGGTPMPSAPAPAKKVDAPKPVSSQSSGSPDKGAGDQRISPGSAPAVATTAPEVRPDAAATKVDPKKLDPKADPKKPASPKPDPAKAAASKGGSR